MDAGDSNLSPVSTEGASENGERPLLSTSIYPSLNNHNSHQVDNDCMRSNGSTVNESAEESGVFLLEPKRVTVEPTEAKSRRQSEEDLRCGIGSCRPSCLSWAADKKPFLMVYCLTTIGMGMFFTYLVSIVTTLEKVFQIQSVTSGVIISASEFGQISASLLLTYFLGQAHRPKWISCAMVLFSVSVLFCSVPHFLTDYSRFFEGHHTDVVAKVVQNTSSSGDLQRTYLCGSSNASVVVDDGSCSTNEEQLDKDRHFLRIAIGIFFLSIYGVGVGTCCINTLGIPYLDDNVASKESALYFSVSIGMRIMGPVLGYLLGSFCISKFVFPWLEVEYEVGDEEWVGAWWLGLSMICGCMLILALAMRAFPHRLPRRRGKKVSFTLPPSLQEKPHKPRLKDFPVALGKLLVNKILLLLTASSVLHLLPIAGLYTFLPKYLETQFRLKPNHSALISGMGGIFPMGLGILTSGMVIRHFKPGARMVAFWNALAAFVYSAGMIIFMFIGCDQTELVGLNSESSSDSNWLGSCNGNCHCQDDIFSPVCGNDSITYYTPCHAGCTVFNSTQELFEDCSCFDGTAIRGACMPPCNTLTIYVVLFAFFAMFHATTEVGSMLLTLRCVQPQEKSMALGLITMCLGIFGNVPCPIIYGAVVDTSCQIWQTNCGVQGSCLHYDSKRFRMFFHGTTAGFMFLAFLVDLVIWVKAGEIQLEDDKENEAVNKEDGNCRSNGAATSPASEQSIASDRRYCTIPQSPLMNRLQDLSPPIMVDEHPSTIDFLGT